MTEPMFGVSRLRDLWVVHAGPETLGVVVFVGFDEGIARALNENLNDALERAQGAERRRRAEEAARQ